MFKKCKKGVNNCVKCVNKLCCIIINIVIIIVIFDMIIVDVVFIVVAVVVVVVFNKSNQLNVRKNLLCFFYDVSTCDVIGVYVRVDNIF